MTGVRPSPATVFPSFGSIVRHEFGPRKNLPPYVAIPSQSGYGGTGYLGSAYGAFSLGADPGSSSFRVRDLALPSGIDAKRFGKRKDMRSIVDALFSSLEKADTLAGMDAFYKRAYAMISSPEARAAFDINKEPAKVRDRYGRNTAGGRLLLARRLVENGVRMITINSFLTVFDQLSWDIHGSKPFISVKQMKDHVAPMYDQGYSALIEDLDERGLLGDTLVTTLAEFGRTPKINKSAGRDHWPSVHAA